MEQQKQMLSLWNSIAEVYGKSKDIAAVLARMSIDEGLSATEVYAAWREWMRQGKNTMPTFGDLLKILRPESNTSARQLATMLASIVPQLISKHGYYWSQGEWTSQGGPLYAGKDGVLYWTFKEAVESYLGRFATIVMNQWRTLCETWDDNPTTHFAQIRDRIESEIVSSEQLKAEALTLTHKQREIIEHGKKDVLTLQQKHQNGEIEVSYDE